MVSGEVLWGGDEDKTREAFTEIDGKRWYITGESGALDEDGRFILAGGAVTAKIGGKVVGLQRIDSLIGSHPAVKIAGSIGIPDERLGEAIMTAVELKEGEKATEEEIKEFCKGKMEKYEIPKRIVFLKEGEMPITRYGLVRYAPLKEMIRKKGYL